MIKVYSYPQGETRDHDAFDWQVDDGYLTLILKNGDQLATYAPGNWAAVVDLDPHKVSE